MYEMIPIALVESARTTEEGDYWGGMESRIVLTSEVQPEALDGIMDFSHVEVIFVLHEAPLETIARGARHPRNNPAWPMTGILAQRGRNRPNRIGCTIARVIRREENALIVSELDAMHGTPVLDLKPVMQEFLPRTEVIQPQWSREVMADYWTNLKKS